MKQKKGLAGITILFFMLIAVAGLDGDFEKKEQSVFGALSDEEHPKIALTFDDGPHPVYTEELRRKYIAQRCVRGCTSECGISQLCFSQRDRDYILGIPDRMPHQPCKRIAAADRRKGEGNRQTGRVSGQPAFLQNVQACDRHDPAGVSQTQCIILEVYLCRYYKQPRYFYHGCFSFAKIKKR